MSDLQYILEAVEKQAGLQVVRLEVRSVGTASRSLRLRSHIGRLGKYPSATTLFVLDTRNPPLCSSSEKDSNSSKDN